MRIFLQVKPAISNKEFKPPIKRLALIFLLAAFFTSTLSAQGFKPYSGGLKGPKGIELVPFAGFQFGGKISAVTFQNSDAEVSFNDGLEFGVSLETPPAFTGARIQLMWSMQNSRLDFQNNQTGENGTAFDMKIHYFQIGAVYEASQSDGPVPFGVISFGTALFNPKESGLNNEWRFAFGFSAGIKVYATERFGFRFQGRMLVPMQWGSGGLWCRDNETDCTISVEGTSAIIQGEFSGGLMLIL
mgnify:CR=1 FL=1